MEIWFLFTVATSLAKYKGSIIVARMLENKWQILAHHDLHSTHSLWLIVGRNSTAVWQCLPWCGGGEVEGFVLRVCYSWPLVFVALTIHEGWVKKISKLVRVKWDKTHLMVVLGLPWAMLTSGALSVSFLFSEVSNCKPTVCTAGKCIGRKKGYNEEAMFPKLWVF